MTYPNDPNRLDPNLQSTSDLNGPAPIRSGTNYTAWIIGVAVAVAVIIAIVAYPQSTTTDTAVNNPNTPVTRDTPPSPAPATTDTKPTVLPPNNRLAHS